MARQNRTPNTPAAGGAWQGRIRLDRIVLDRKLRWFVGREVVELPNSTEWVLIDEPLPERDGRDDGVHNAQFDLGPGVPTDNKGGKKGGKGKGKSSVPPGPAPKSRSCGWVPTPPCHYLDRPDWKKQVNRFLVPCEQNPDKHWIRQARGFSLGQLFILHGMDWSANSLYRFYLSCPVLALKQKREKSSGTRLSVHIAGEMQFRAESPSVQNILRSCKYIQHVRVLVAST